MKKFAAAALVALPLLAAPAFAADPDPEIAKFREAYTTGTGLAYVVMPDEKGAEQVYRYGDNSRLAARKDDKGFMLFTCNSPHVFLVQDAKAKAALAKARVVKVGEAGFNDLDARYLSACRNPLVKSAIPNAKAATAPAADAELAGFRDAYLAGTGLAYVVMPDEKGAEQVYRYGDNSREAARRDTRGFMLFTCNSPHVFLAQDAKAKASLLKAKVVKPGEPRFEELDGRYLTNCKNPLVKSALPAAPAKKQ